MVNFAKCSSRYLPLNETLTPAQYDLYTYTGHVQGIAQNRNTQLNLQGCKALCGKGSDLYPWSQWSSTLTTWIFPIIGIILQAPFESNEILRTFLTLVRWIGNPMASLTYILWNIKMTGRSATIVDMAWHPAFKMAEEQNNNFESIRDSFFLLNVMNQYTMQQHCEKPEAEGLLRIALFSKDIRLLREGVHAIEPGSQEPRTDLSRLEKEGHLDFQRRELALYLRKFRKRGVVPVYIATVLFIISLAFSINAAFGLQGQQTQSHDLALGLLLSWLPVLFLSAVVDRNPVAADEFRIQLNRLIDRVRRSLMDDEVMALYIDSIHNEEEQELMENWVLQTNAECRDLNDFFVAFAGQGRVRWHYGCCHPIVRDIEEAYLNNAGRDWLLQEERKARTQLVLGRPHEEALYRFDRREGWQILSSIIIVWGTVIGAFTLSYYVPTIGLGCRSGGYMIYLAIASLIFAVEMATWPLIHKKRLSRKGKEIVHWILVSMEVVSTGWLTYIIFAQISGSYQTCECLTSAWGGQNYIDLTQWATTDSTMTHRSWIVSTVVSVSVMGLAMLYIVAQWLFQSHLNTVDKDKAAHFRPVRIAMLRMLPQRKIMSRRKQSGSDPRSRSLQRAGTAAMESGRRSTGPEGVPMVHPSCSAPGTTLSVTQPSSSRTISNVGTSSSRPKDDAQLEMDC